MPTVLLLAAVLTASSPAVAPRVRLALEIEFPQGVSDVVGTDAIGEAASIWSRYGVDIVARVPAPCRWLPDDVIALEVRPASPGPHRWQTPLAAIAFSPSGTPGDVISIFYEDIVRFSSRSVFGSAEPEWPQAVRQQMTARVLGRVLAHEIGHFLLRSPAHATTGLMRPVQSAADLTSGFAGLFLLTPTERERLDFVLGADKEKGPADSRPSK